MIDNKIDIRERLKNITVGTQLKPAVTKDIVKRIQRNETHRNYIAT